MLRYIVKELLVDERNKKNNTFYAKVPIKQVNNLIDAKATEFIFIDEKSGYEYLVPFKQNNKFDIKIEDEFKPLDVKAVKYEIYQQFEVSVDQDFITPFERWLLNHFHYSWYNELIPVLSHQYFKNVLSYLKQCWDKGNELTPHKDDIFNVFKYPVWHYKYVWLGQSPYPNIKDANGYAFASRDSENKPVSLKAIEEAIRRDCKINGGFKSNDLSSLIGQGVMLLNCSLTYNKTTGKPHLDVWKPFIEFVIKTMNRKYEVSYILFGSDAKSFKPVINPNHIVFICQHPAAAAYQNRSFESGGVFEAFQSHTNINYFL